VTVSLPGFLETGSQQAMIVAILSGAGHTPGQAFGFGFGTKLTQAGLNIVLALLAARIMIGPLQLRTRLSQKLRPGAKAEAGERGLRQPVRKRADAVGAARTRSSTS
jgi:hypothetical protein